MQTPFFFVCPYAEGVVFSCKVLALNVFPNGAALDLSAPEQDVGARHGVPVCCRILQSCPNLHFRMHLWSRAEHRHLYCGEECARFVSHKSDMLEHQPAFSSWVWPAGGAHSQRNCFCCCHPHFGAVLELPGRQGRLRHL